MSQLRELITREKQECWQYQSKVLRESIDDLERIRHRLLHDFIQGPGAGAELVEKKKSGLKRVAVHASEKLDWQTYLIPLAELYNVLALSGETIGFNVGTVPAVLTEAREQMNKLLLKPRANLPTGRAILKRLKPLNVTYSDKRIRQIEKSKPEMKVKLAKDLAVYISRKARARGWGLQRDTRAVVNRH